MLSRDQILGAADRKTVEVPVPEWGGVVYVRSLSGSERDALEFAVSKAHKAGDLQKNARARFAVAYTCDASGAAIFTEADLEALGAKNASALERIWKAGEKLNEMSEQDIEDLAKN